MHVYIIYFCTLNSIKSFIDVVFEVLSCRLIFFTDIPRENILLTISLGTPRDAFRRKKIDFTLGLIYDVTSVVALNVHISYKSFNNSKLTEDVRF